MKNQKEQSKDFQWNQKKVIKDYSFDPIKTVSIPEINTVTSTSQVSTKAGRPKKSAADKKRPFTLKINPVLSKSIKDYATKTGLTNTAIIEQALIEFFENKK